jgi:branched-chain amino acid transport system ATP-binding protein
METILEVSNVGKKFGGFTALAGVNLNVGRGERLGLIGPNGSGKTTLINCISGALFNDGGSIRFDGREISGLKANVRTKLGVARSFQIPRPFRSMNVLENLMVPLAYVNGESGNSARAEAMRILEHMGLAAKAQTTSSQLSQVELRKMELARCDGCATEAADLRRGDGRAGRCRGRGGAEDPARAQ